MNIIRPVVINGAGLVASTPPIPDTAAGDPTSVWNAGTTYAANARVYRTSDYGIFTSVQGGNLNKPLTDTAWWIRTGTMNAFRAFDQKTGSKSTRVAELSFDITLPSRVNSVAFVGVRGTKVAYQVINPALIDTPRDGFEGILPEGFVLGSVLDDFIGIMSEGERTLVDTSDIVDWWSYFHWTPTYQNLAVFEEVVGSAGMRMRLTVSSSAADFAEVGEIVLGTSINIGQTLVNTELGFDDQSVIERSEWGDVNVGKRPSWDTVTFAFSAPVGSENKIRRALQSVSGAPAFFYADATSESLARGLAVYGLARPLRLQLNSRGWSFGTLETEEMI